MTKCSAPYLALPICRVYCARDLDSIPRPVSTDETAAAAPAYPLDGMGVVSATRARVRRQAACHKSQKKIQRQGTGGEHIVKQRDPSFCYCDRRFAPKRVSARLPRRSPTFPTVQYLFVCFFVYQQ